MIIGLVVVCMYALGGMVVCIQLILVIKLVLILISLCSGLVWFDVVFWSWLARSI